MTGGGEPDAGPEGDGGTVEVRYRGVPVRTFLDLQEALDGYQRELQLSHVGGSAPAVPPEVAEGLVRVREAMVDLRLTLHDQASRAREDGQDVADLVAEYPTGSRAAFVWVMDASRRADAAAEEGAFLAPPLSEEVRHLQSWMYRELLDQLDGAAPTGYRAPGSSPS